MKVPLADYGEAATISETIHMTYDMDNAAGAAGTYTAPFNVPAYAVIEDIIVSQITPWNAGTSAALDVGDAADPNGFYAAVNMKATDLVAGESLSFSHAGGKAGAYNSGTNTHWDARASSSDRVVTASLVTVGTATAGSTLITVVMAKNPGSVAERLQGTFA